MSLVTTTLLSAITASQTTIKLTSGTGIRKGNFLRVDSEFMQITDDSVTDFPHVDRGVNGTQAVAHGALSDATHGIGSEFISQSPSLNIVSYGVTGAIAIPKVESLILLTKAGVGAMTLAAPSKGSSGLRLTIMSETAQAHTVTNTTPGFNGADTAGDVATFGGAKGDNLVIVSVGGQWNVVSAKNVTLG